MSDSGEIFREKNYTIWKTRFGMNFYVFKDNESKVQLETPNYQEAINYIKMELSKNV